MWHMQFNDLHLHGQTIYPFKTGTFKKGMNLLVPFFSMKILKLVMYMFLYTESFRITYSRTSVMWTPKGRAKIVHNSEVSTLVKLGVVWATDCTQWYHFFNRIIQGKQTGRAKSVHKGRVSTKAGCPQGGVLLYKRNSNIL